MEEEGGWRGIWTVGALRGGWWRVEVGGNGIRGWDSDEGTLVLVFESCLSAHSRYDSIFRTSA